jgi:hypothetical protein
MNNISNVGKMVIAGVIAACLIIVAVIYKPAPASAPATPGTPITATGGAQQSITTPSAPAAAQQSAATTPVKPTTPVAAPVPSIKLITPVEGDVWKMETQNFVSWNKEGSVSGYIYLTNAATKEFVGVINPQLGPHQTSYTWNTRDLLLARDNPFKKTITPGTYVLHIAFDGNHLPLISSPAFTIVQ